MVSLELTALPSVPIELCFGRVPGTPRLLVLMLSKHYSAGSALAASLLLHPQPVEFGPIPFLQQS